MAKPPSWNQIRADAAVFAARWADEKDENAGAQGFWTELLGIFGVDRKRVAVFEKRAERASTKGRGRIDMFWPGVIAVEHKSAGKDLKAAEQQCLDYLEGMAQEELPELVVTSDFARFRVLDLAGDRTPYEFAIADLPKEVERFSAIAGYGTSRLGVSQSEVDAHAAALMGELYEEIADIGFTEHETSVFLTRMLFLFFGDDTGLWERNLLLEYIETRTSVDGSDLGPQLAMLFQTLDRPVENRASALDETLRRFPYVNGGLFKDRLDIPAFNSTIRKQLIELCLIDWGAIIPAIFGSMFQAVKSKEARRSLGEHYTSEENILRLIGPMFLDDLRAEFEVSRDDVKRLNRLRDRLGQLKILDPACGAGNFLSITYRELRALELDILRRLRHLTGAVQLSLDPTLGLKVSPDQFFGIEVEEWPARIAEVSLFLVDHQANLRLAAEFGQLPDRLPISTNATIVQANALRIAWDEVVTFDQNTFIIGNPPFLGHAMRDQQQNEDMDLVWGSVRGAGALDYVTCWFRRAADYLDGTGSRAAFVSTNSLSQGEQPATMWSYLYTRDIHIDFAHRSFNWTNEARGKAAVHVVITGFSQGRKASLKPLWSYPDINKPGIRSEVPVINAYLSGAAEVLVTNRRTPLSANVPPMLFGSMANDGGHLIVKPDEVEALRASDPIAASYLRLFLGGAELIQGRDRYCLWLVDASPSDVRSSPVISARVREVQRLRAASPRAATRNLAATSALFGENRQPSTPYLAVPRVSSGARAYIPIALLGPDVIASDQLLTVANADNVAFGVLASRAFTVWNATVSGRLKSDYRISAEVTYNNFPWPQLTESQRDAVGAAAQGVLDARAAHDGSTLADLYDPLAMPADLVLAHRALDRVVLSAYALSYDALDADIMARLFELYEGLLAADQLPLEGAKKPARKRAAARG